MNKKLHVEPDLEYLSLGKSSEHFSTHDLACAAALIACGYKFECLDREDSRRAKFVFEGASGIELTIRKFWDGQLSVDAQGYFNVIKRLKNEIYSG